METDGLGVRKTAGERAEARESRCRPFLVVAADGGRGQGFRVVRSGSRGGGELAFGRDGTERLLEPHPAEEVALRGGARPGEARHERRQPPRRVRMEQVRRAHGRRGIRLHPPRLVPGTRRVCSGPGQRERDTELEPDEGAVRVARGEDAEAAHRPGRPRL